MTKPTEETQIAVLTEQVKTVGITLGKMDAKLDNLVNQFTTKSEFTPVRNLVYGMVGLILVGFVGALIALVFKSQ